MKRTIKRLVSTAMTAIMLTAMPINCGVGAAAVWGMDAGIVNAGGWFETLYAQWNDQNPQGATVTYTNNATGESTTLTGEDKKYLQRTDSQGAARVDIPGLRAGSYDIKIIASDGKIYEQNNINVMANDRSGYAHFNYTEGVGAYLDDGTLKPNSKVIYVTDENKDTVTVTAADGTSVSGIGNILNSSGGQPRKNNKGVVVSTVINTNSGIIKKLAEEGTPLAVRFVGKVTAPEGLTAYDSYDYGGTPGDNGYMARIQSGKDITIEGIGADAEINGWGIHFMCQSSNPELGKSFEARNITFWGSPEDSLGMEGVQSGSTLTAPVERCWIHNCSFLPQPIANPAESDKSEGDGCCDFKRGQYMTMSYCYFANAHKTNLVGSSDSSLQYHITWHHNMWEKCEARGPLGRQANIHIYNNYYKNQTSYAMNPRANCYIFSEYNTMEYCKNPMQIKSGAIKSYNDTLLGCSNAIDGTFVKNKNEAVASANIYSGFELSSELSYIPTGNYSLQENAAEAKATCMAYSGSMKTEVIDETKIDTSIIPTDIVPTAAVELPFSASFGKTAAGTNPTTVGKQTIANVVYNPTKIGSADMTIKNAGIVFRLDSRAKITMTGANGTYTAVLYDTQGRTIINTTGQAIVEPGVYVIQSSGFDAGKQVFKEAKINSLLIEAAGNDETLSTTEAYTETTSTNNEDSSEVTTGSPEYTGKGLVWNYTDGTNTLNVLADGDDWSNAKPVTYNGATLTSAIKMEASTNISFNAPGRGKLTIVSRSDKSSAFVLLNDVKTAISSDGSVTIPVEAGDISITRNSTSTGIYMLIFEADEVLDKEYKYGDADNSGKLTANDAAMILKRTLETGYLTELDKLGGEKYLDVTGDGSITAGDAAAVLSLVLE